MSYRLTSGKAGPATARSDAAGAAPAPWERQHTGFQRDNCIRLSASI